MHATCLARTELCISTILRRGYLKVTTFIRVCSDLYLVLVHMRYCSNPRLTDILAENHVETNYFDFFSLDVEGAEGQVLKSIDFDKLGFGIIFVEADKNDPAKDEEVRSILKSNGYTHFSNYQRSDWFFNDQFLSIYKELWHGNVVA